MNKETLNLLQPLGRYYDIKVDLEAARARLTLASSEYVILCELGDPNLMVGFDSMSPSRSPDAPMYWGRGLAASCGFSGLHIYPLQNCWYRRVSLRDMTCRMRDTGFFELFSRRVAAGGSMGGCGAIWHASAMGCTEILAFNPQVVLDEEMIQSGETRYREGWQETWRREDLKKVVDDVNVLTVVYDPRVKLDAGHISLLRDCKPDLNEVCVPYAGHSTPVFLSKTGTLSALMEGFVRGDDISYLGRKAAESRKSVGRYYANMVIRARNSGRSKLADRLQARAICGKMLPPVTSSDDYRPD